MADLLTVVHVYPELLGTYGDRGNALALVHRARGRGIASRVLEVHGERIQVGEVDKGRSENRNKHECGDHDYGDQGRDVVF